MIMTRRASNDESNDNEKELVDFKNINSDSIITSIATVKKKISFFADTNYVELTKITNCWKISVIRFGDLEIKYFPIKAVILKMFYLKNITRAKIQVVAMSNSVLPPDLSNIQSVTFSNLH